MKKFITVFLCLAVLFASGFGGVGKAVAADEIAQLVLSDNEASIETGDSKALTATAVYVGGKTEDVTVKTTWSSADDNIATVYAGTIRGKSEGKVTIVANYLGKSVSVNVEVLKKVRTLTKDKQTITIRTGEDKAEQVTLTAIYDDNKTADVTEKAQWTSDNQAVATVLNGKIVGHTSGTAVVTAKYGKQSVTIPVNVEIVKRLDPSKSEVSLLLKDKQDTAEIELTAIFPDGKSEIVTEKAEWSSSNEAVADAINGVIKAYGSGTATITAKYGTKTATIKVDVDRTMKLEMTPQNLFMQIKDGSKKLAVKAFYEKEQSMVEDDVTDKAEWTSSNSDVATVTKGTVIPLKAGEVTITAKYGDKSVTTTIDVEVPRRLEASQDYIAASVQDTTEKSISITAYYANDSKQDVTDKVEWSSSNEAIVSVNKGKLKALKAGEVTITAKYADKVVTIRVDVDIPKQIVADPTSLDLQVGGTKQITLNALYGDGTNVRTENITELAEWSSSADSIVEVRKGYVTGVTTGAATITAKYGNRTVTISVSVGIVKSLSVKKDDAAVDKLVMKKDDTAQLKLIVEYTDKTTKDVTNLATWAPEESKIAQVNSDGMVKAKGPGKVDISASFGGKTVKVAVEVDQTESLTASDRSIFMSVGETRAITLNPNDSNSVYVTQQADWSSSSSSVADVAGGKITAYKNGKTTITAKYGGKSVSILVEVEILDKLEADTRFVQLKTLGEKKDKEFTVKLTATLSSGQKIDVTDKADWKVSSYKIADVDNQGVIKATGYGKTSVTAKYGGKSVSIPVEVDQIKYLKVNQVNLSLKPGQKANVKAVATYWDGTDIDVSIPALWTTSSVQKADVKDGEIIAHGVGRATINVKFAGKQAQVIVNVTK
ncbi:hypothetical protein E0485_22065 [Paenibacillus albiflavus]|uniref:BIG2 domain-containing protein n=2 Tax=Paenibacillus albiflavus TaxID=2545760 RepID=A0A4R4E4F2_9BACL|nr:hypothetical protein E0485_22065 [Paenibacillus albiflavus]